ncbi:PSD1 and planctomycete cytochrome C domain-containing protein [Opitutaceae bacterium]|nr:PSD1 and planctomycete cytochrome C domain-containing protein [Opitutaceae bacterium]
MEFPSLRFPLPRFTHALTGGVSILLSASTFVAAAGVPAEIEFNRDVRPILSNTCFKCHGPDEKNNQSKLRLDLRDFAIDPHVNKAGRTITGIVPGKPDESEVWLRLTSTDPVKIMPPPDALHQASDLDRAIIRRWIEQGAEYAPHWSYIMPAKVSPPAVASTDRVRNAIDHFVLRKLEDADIELHPEADRATLLRRLSLDLIGLPPTPAELDMFLNDMSPSAHERAVDRLLASPHFGERMAVPWLDLVRFSDTVGFHGDQRQNIFPYRDYVIDAFNQNKPYDDFVREQLAGDLLSDPTPEQIVATGFNRLNLMTREGGAQPQEYLAKSAADRVRAVSTTFMGSTVGCAECHDHKYDPFTTRDFYSLAAYFADVKQWGVYSDYKYTPNPDLKGFNNDFPFPPEMDVESAYLKRRSARLRQELASQIDHVAQAILAEPDGRQDVLNWAQANGDAWPDSGAWSSPKRTEVTGDDYTTVEQLDDGSVRLASIPETKRPRNSKSWPTLTISPEPGVVAAIRLDALPDDEAEGKVARNDLGSFTVTPQIDVLRKGSTQPEKLTLAAGFVDHDSWTYSNAYMETSVENRWRSAPQYAREKQTVIYQLETPVTLAEGDELVVTLKTSDLARARIFSSPRGLQLKPESLDQKLLVAMDAALEGMSLEQDQWRLLAAEYFKSTSADDSPAYANAIVTMREIAACREGMAFTMVTEASEPLVTRVLPRGNWQDESGEIVSPAPPAFLAKGAPPSSERATRLDLAEWIVSSENPLTARTQVNRMWNQFFGTGLSAVVDDLGLQGEYPSHPELLDWLAVEFVESGWDLKHMVRLIVNSATYRQQSVYRPDLRDVDPDNRLLAAHPSRRMEAEFVRDNALFVAGLLDTEIGGPSATPYQPDGYYVSLNFPKRRYQAERDERQYRRGVYTHVQRTFVHPMMANFDAPSREECTADRTVSNTPQQALTLLNDPTFVEAARALAERAMTEPARTDFESRIEHAFRLVLARSPSAEERTGLKEFYFAQHANYSDEPDDAAALAAVGLHVTDEMLDRVELAAWTQVARVLLNLNETLMRY